MSKRIAERRLAAILAADVAGYSRLMSAQEESTLRTLKAHRRVFQDQIAAYHGRIVDTAGDSVLAEFASPVAAVECALAVQGELARRNAELPAEHAMEFRIGINLGDVIVDGDAIYGDGVNVAARLEGLAEPGGIAVSGGVYDLVRGKIDRTFTSAGRRRVKNIPEPVRVYSVMPPEEEERLRRRRLAVRWWAKAGALGAAALLAAFALGWLALRPVPDPAGSSAFRTFRDCARCPELVEIPAGAYVRGSPQNEPGRAPTEGPVATVEIARPFALARYETTFAEWDQCVADRACDHAPNDRGWGRGNLPVIYVSWLDLQKYLDWLSARAGVRYRLPSEAEWEYAARAGSAAAYPWGDEPGRGMANCEGCAEGHSNRTLPIGSFPPNRMGLHDLTGNVMEWTADCWNGSYAGAPADGSPWLTGDCQKRAVRGGAWGLEVVEARSAVRRGDNQDLRSGRRGFRVARDLP